MKPPTDVISVVKNKEAARNTNPLTSLSALPAYFRDSNFLADMDTAE